MSAAISWASLGLSGKFGIVACGKSKNEAPALSLRPDFRAADKITLRNDADQLACCEDSRFWTAGCNL